MAHSETLRFSAPLLAVRMPGVALPAAPVKPTVDVDALTRAAYERGRLEGEQAVSEQLVRQRVEFSELQNGLLAALRGTFPRVVQECEATMVTLALEAAQRLVAGLPISVDMVEATVREAIAQANDTSEMEVLVNEADLRILQEAHSPLLDPVTGPQKLRVTASPDISRGGCLIHTRFGTVDARRETKLENLKESLAA
jgi:flagellar assembly protein FliH